MSYKRKPLIIGKEVERKPLIHHIIDLLKAVTNYLSYRFTGNVIEWDDIAQDIDESDKDKPMNWDDEPDYPYNTEFGDGLTHEEMEKIDLANRDREEKINKESDHDPEDYLGI